MDFKNQLPLWKNGGAEPSEELKENGFSPGYKPPAGVFNWFWHKVSNCIKELQQKLSDAPIPLTGVCATAKSTTAKIVTCPDFKVYDGAKIAVTFNNGNSANYMTLNVNGTGAYFAWFPIGSSRTYNDELISKLIVAGGVYEFVYQDGSTPKWVYCGMTSIPIDDETPAYTEATARDNLASGEKLSTAFGKIKKWFTDLKAVAFSNNYNDLDNKPTSMQNPNSLTLTMNGSSTSYNGASSVSESWYAPTSMGTAGYELVSNGSGAPVWKAPSYAVCSTAAGTAAKTASISNFKLVTGARVCIKFTNEHTSSTAATLNVNSTGAKTIYYKGVTVTNGSLSTNRHSWNAGEMVELVYDGTYWKSIGSDLKNPCVNSRCIVVGRGASHTLSECDYICSYGGDMAVGIQKAIDACPNDGKVILLSGGAYDLSSTLTINKDITIEALGKAVLRWSGSSISLPLMQRSDAVTGRTITFKGIDFVIGYANGAPTTLIGDLTALFLFTKNGVGAKVIFEDCSWNFNLGTNSIIPAFVKAKQVYFRNGVIDIDTTSVAWTSGYSCSTGIDCEECHVTQSQITLYNSDNSNGYDLNFINNCNYAKVDGNSITLSGASRLCRTANSADIVVSHNTIHLKSVTSSISSYDSTKPYHKIFTGNNVYYYRQLHLHFATVTDNTFYNSYGTPSSASKKIRIYNPTIISANRFYGATSFDFNGYVCVFSGNLLSQALTNTTFPAGSINTNNVTGY